MSLVRYQSPELSTWPSFDRWIDLRDEMNSLFELPTMGNLTRQAQLFSGWTPALDLYQDNDNVIATVELPGMRKEDIDISLRDGVLTIAGERQSSLGEGENAERTEPGRIGERVGLVDPAAGAEGGEIADVGPLLPRLQGRLP